MQPPILFGGGEHGGQGSPAMMVPGYLTIGGMPAPGMSPPFPMMAPYGFPPPVAFPPQAPMDRDIPPPPSSAAPAAAADEKKDEDEGEYADVSFSDIFKQFILLGWTAFGGPAAHIALFQKVFIERLRWMSAPLFMELFALGQCLPGPTSTQVSFAIGLIKKGVPGGLLSGMLFQYPGLFMMALIGWGADNVNFQIDVVKGLVAGLSAVGVALVVGAAFSLSVKVCPDRETRALCLLSAVLAYIYQAAWLYVAVIAFGGLITIARDWSKPVKEAPGKEGIESLGASKVTGAILIVIWAGLLATVISLRQTLPYEGANKGLFWFEAFFRSGSIIFGGGQVVLPLLLNEVTQYEVVCNTNSIGKQICDRVPDYKLYPEGDARIKSWLTEEQFLAGLAISQGMPGPLFNFSAYLGALCAAGAGWNVAVGVICAWFGLFGPGILLIFGVLPFWGSFRKLPIYRRALPGLNSAAVGLVVAAAFQLYDTARRASPFPETSVAIGMIGFTFVEIYKQQAPLAVAGGGILGIIAWALRIRWSVGIDEGR